MAHNPLDFTQPVGLLLAAVLHFIPDSDGPEQILATLCGQLSPGSYLAISHACRDTIPDIATVPGRSPQYLPRRQAIARFFDGFTLLEPGLVWLPEWRSDSPGDVPEDPAALWGVAGVGRYDAIAR